MQDEITVSPLVDILSKQLGKEVVMSGDKYVFLDTKTEVVQSEVELAMISQDAKILEQAKASKLQQIEEDYMSSEEQTVEVSGVIYFSGTSSVEAIDSYVRLNRLTGTTTHNIWDVNGTEHSLTDSEVDGVILAIGIQASTNKFTKKNRKVALAVATTIAEVEAV